MGFSDPLDSGYGSPGSEPLGSPSHPAPETANEIFDLDDPTLDPNAAFTAKLRGRTLKIPRSLVNLFDEPEFNWKKSHEPHTSQWTKQQKATYDRLRSDTDALLDLQVL